MPLKKDDLDKRGELPTGQWRETDDVPVGQMVYHLAESIANAQTKLDLNAAEVAKTLDETEVEVVPQITQHVHEDGSITTERAESVERSLLELGFTPSRYHFSEATIEVDFDTKMSEEVEGERGSGVGMRAGTSEARQHRKFNRSVETNTHVKAKLEPMAPPTGLTPERNTQPAESPSAGGPGDDEQDAGGSDDRRAGDDAAAEEGTGGDQQAADDGGDRSAGGTEQASDEQAGAAGQSGSDDGRASGDGDDGQAGGTRSTGATPGRATGEVGRGATAQ